MLFSIITPSYGQLDWLRLCIASVADQVGGEKADKLTSLKAKIKEPGEDVSGQGAEVGTQVSGFNFQVSIPSTHGFAVEHIIQDGGTPGIEEFAREMGAEFYRDGRFVFGPQPSTLDSRLYRLAIYSEADAGMYDALNKGIERMRGDLWAWLNCDEQYLPGTLAYAAEWFAEHRDADILCGDALLVDGEGRAFSYRRIVPPRWYHTRMVHLSSLSCASFYRRGVVARGGIFDTSWRSLGDAEWMARLLKAGVKVDTCKRLLSSFAFTGQNTSESPLAAKEASRWRQMPGAPPLWLKEPIVLFHRMRKFLAGAYGKKDIAYEIHATGKEGRIKHEAEGIGWRWPVSERSQRTEVRGQRSEDGGRRSEGGGQSNLLGLTLPVLWTPLAATTYRGLSELLIAAVEKGQSRLAVDFANTHVVTLRRHDPEFADLTDCIDVTVPDGMPLVWVVNAKGARLEDRVYGPTFTRKFLEECPQGMTHYLVGGSAECGARFSERMLALNPSLNFVGGCHGICSSEGMMEDDEAVLRDIREKRPDFIWVGLGTPKQYGWINRIKPKLDHGILLAVGFAFDVNAGMKPDAPAWMQRNGLTWLYRMTSEPERLVGRYVKWNTLFLWYLGWDWVTEKAKKLKSKKAAVTAATSSAGRHDAACEAVRRTRQPGGCEAKQWSGKQTSDLEESSRETVMHDRKFGMAWNRSDSPKLQILKMAMGIIDLFGSDIKDDVTGVKLGRGLLIGFFGRLYLIGYEGRPLVPRFQPQKRLTYWKQRLVFTAQTPPDFPRIAERSEAEKSENPKVLNILLAHQGGESFEKIRAWWKSVCPEENLWVAFGGTREAFEALDYPRKIFIDDPRLRTRDHQREKQCYSGVLRAMAPTVEREAPDYIYFSEYDQLPLVPDLNRRQVEALVAEGADVLGHWLYRVDGTGHWHQLYHESDPRFYPFWKSVSRREDPTVVLSMFGSGSFWTKEAFLAMASQDQKIECYLEIYLPTLAHHLGFRVRPWREGQHLISNLPSPEVTVELAQKKGCWTVHPVKTLEGKAETLKRELPRKAET